MKRIKFSNLLIWAFILIACFAALFPIYVMVSGSMKSSQELALNSYGLPSAFSLENYKRLGSYNSGIILRTYLNSIFITGAHTAIAIFLSALAAYAFSKFRFRGRNALFVMLLSTMMIPFELTIPPLYSIFSKIGWMNTYRIQILPFTANVFAMFMMKQYMESIPDSIIEAARIDGAGEWKCFTRIMLPAARPAIGASTILVALAKFNDYLWPSTVVTDQTLSPIMTVLPTLNEEGALWYVPKELVLTGCTIVIIPLLILFVVFQDQFVNSVTIGAVKE